MPGNRGISHPGPTDTLLFFLWFRDQAPLINIIVRGLVFDPLADRLGVQLPAPNNGPQLQRLTRAGLAMVGVGPLIGPLRARVSLSDF